MELNMSNFPDATGYSEQSSSSLVQNNAAATALAHWPLVTACTGATVALAMCFLRKVSTPKEDPLSHLPAVGTGSIADRFKQFMAGGGWDIYVEGYKKFKDGVFKVAVSPDSERIVLPVKFLPELNKQHDKNLSFQELLQDRLQSKHTLFNGADATQAVGNALKYFIKAALAPSLPRFTAILLDGTFQSLDIELPTSHDWSEVNIYDRLHRLTARATGRVFVGPELCHNETYISCATQYLVKIYKSASATAALPLFLRPILAPYLPQTRAWKQCMSDLAETLQPAIAARMDEISEGGAGYQKPEDALQCIIDSLGVKPEDGLEGHGAVAVMQMAANIAAIDTPAAVMTNAMYSLAADSELTNMLREDTKQAIDATGGTFTHDSLQKMMKLDSFMKEIMRRFPNKAVTFQRRVLRTFVLSNGQVIPQGSIVEVPWAGIASDSEIYPDADDFDALRFYEPPKAEDESTGGEEISWSNRLVGSSPTSLSWGYGRHACPGRFFAANEMKIIVAALLLTYDFRMPDGVKGRYKNVHVNSYEAPDLKKMIMIRKL